MPRWNVWGDEEVEFLKAHCDSMSRREIAERLVNKTAEQVAVKIHALGLGSRAAHAERLAAQHGLAAGKTFGRLTVIGPAPPLVRYGNHRYRQVMCRCECGKELAVVTSRLRAGGMRDCPRCGIRRGAESHRTHGMSRTRLYQVWNWVKANAAGVCDAWADDFQSFHDWAEGSGYVDGMMLRRTNDNGRFEPSNCFWVLGNKPGRRRVEAWGETKTLREWSKDSRCWVSYQTLMVRVDELGWGVEEAISTPAQKMNFTADDCVAGARFGRLTVVGPVTSAVRYGRRCREVLCRCDCGEEVTAATSDLRLGRKGSCGCLGEQRKYEAVYKHGMSGTRIYNIWASARNRYAGEVCDAWEHDFRLFYNWAMANGYADGQRLRRKDDGKPFGPSNCFWASKPRRVHELSGCPAGEVDWDTPVTALGETKTMREWAEDPRVKGKLS